MAKPLSSGLSGMPQMSAAFAGWTIPITFMKITQSVVDGLVQDIAVPIKIQGTWQPLGPEEIKLKPEEQWSWEWIDLHVRGSAMVFKTNDRVLRDNLRYKVMAAKDYTLNNYTEYHLVRDYSNEIAP